MLATAMALALAAGEPPRLLDGAVGSSDYPASALREGREGLSIIRITITADGRATDCSIAQSSGSFDLDTAACDITTSRTRFTPALDDEGEPVDMTVRLPIRWVLAD
ncbi:energy transducer TonB [Sphingomicrobium sediminis]|uniref:Energy transducer TonB n=1 Tax=Sphingomicrobium sediminis TaxID=2950949 RepID=A0A9X2J4N5_9SPHN|nr:energy transducer TonB [Sphingomicrobium sediminis]MCM8557397.1 energy transducer TonB [Sphingomicrobium sediminis]